MSELQAKLLAAFREAWEDSYIDFTFLGDRDTDTVDEFAAALEAAYLAVQGPSRSLP